MRRGLLAASRLVEGVIVIEDVVEPGSDDQVGHNEGVDGPGSAVLVFHREEVQVVCEDAPAGFVNAAQHPGSAEQVVAVGEAREEVSR